MRLPTTTKSDLLRSLFHPLLPPLKAPLFSKSLISKSKSPRKTRRLTLHKIMPQKTEPMLQKFSNLLKISIFLAKLRKPSISKLIFLKKSRKSQRFKLLKHYNYQFLEEFQFSPSSTPLFYYQSRRFKNGSRRDMLSVLLLCQCFGCVKGGVEEEDCALALDWDAPPPLPPIAGELLEPLDRKDEDEEEEDSVDLRAEKFIQRFYAEMRMQRLE